MTNKKPTVELWSVTQGKLVDFEVTIDGGDICCIHGDEFVKFPGGITKDDLLEFVKCYNEDNRDKVAITPEQVQAEEELKAANAQLLEDLI